MRAALRDVDGFDVLRWMDSPDRGVRLVVYAYLKDHVAPDLLPRVIDSVANEDKPFGQYQGLRAVENQLELSPATLTDEGRRKLQDMQTRIGPAADRGLIIRRNPRALTPVDHVLRPIEWSKSGRGHPARLAVRPSS